MGNRSPGSDVKDWTFITRHGLVLLYVSRKLQCTMREIAGALNVTERTVHRVLEDLQSAGYITRRRTGRGNVYRINEGITLKNGLTRDLAVGDLLGLLGKKGGKGAETDRHGA